MVLDPTFLQELSQKLDSPSISSSEDSLTFSLQDSSTFSLSKVRDKIVLHRHLQLTYSTQSQFDSLLHRILDINLAQFKSSQESLAWDPDLKTLILFREFPADSLFINSLLLSIENFLNSCDFWDDTLKQLGDSTPSPFAFNP